jgi:hypothetical protein
VTRVAPGLTALVLGIALVLGAPAAAPARVQGAHVAGVTVSFGSGQVVHRTVTFSGDSITGIDALRGAGFDVEVYGFSGIGGAVCKIDGVGRAADSSCLNGGDQYWAYWHDGRYSSVGAGASEVHDHDQEQWAWGTGDHAPPTTAFAVPTTTRPVTTTTTAVVPPAPAAGGGGGDPTTPTRPGDPTGGSSTTKPGSSTTSTPHRSTTASTTADAGESSHEPVAKDEQLAGRSVAHTSGSGGDGGGGGGPLAIAGFVIVLAAVVGLTVRARTARGNAAPRN